MEFGLAEVVEYVAIAIEVMAILIVAFGSVEAFGRILRLAFGSATEQDRRETYVGYLRWLVGGLTFQLAADIIHTSIAPTWEDLGKVGAIAVIRTFLSYFVARDVREAVELGEAAGKHERVTASPSPTRSL
jgi:uncharacterized membrane protein